MDVLANNLANANTTGFKEDKAFFSILNQSLGSSELAPGAGVGRASALTGKSLNPAEGSLSYTNRDLDIAIAGNGFLAVQAPQGIRYTRNGDLQLNAQGILTTSEGYSVLGISGRPIALGQGKVQISEDGTVSQEDAAVDRLKIVTFDNLSTLEKEGNSLLAAKGGPDSEKVSIATIKSGYLEQSNVNPVSSMVQMVDLMRHFEAIQKSVSLLMNELNSKAIDKLGQ